MKPTKNFTLGSDVIALMIGEKHPMIMVDRIISYDPTRQQMLAEKYISANDPVFIGHFPDFKLWPGICTIEGLRQSCVLQFVFRSLERKDLINGIAALEDQFKLKPKTDIDLCKQTMEFLKVNSVPRQSDIKLRVKLQAPVFAGCRMVYRILGDPSGSHSWKVQALVNDRIVASGSIEYVKLT